MKLIKTTIVAVAASLISTSAFAGSNPDVSYTSNPSVSLPQMKVVYKVKPAVLIDANPHATGTTKRRIVRIVKTPVDMPIARDASMEAGGQFVYKYGKNTPAKMFRTSTASSAAMPNLFKK